MIGYILTGPCELKEIRLSAVISKHDLETKIKQIRQWIDKKQHVKISVLKKNEDSETVVSYGRAKCF